jgi:hypothetical protein
MGATASYTQFKIETKTSTILRSNRMLLNYLAKVRKSLKFFPPVKRLVPELFKYPPRHSVSEIQRLITLLRREPAPPSNPVSRSVAHSFSTLRSCEPHPLSVATQSLRQQLLPVSVSQSQNSTLHAVLRRTTGHWLKSLVEKTLKFCNSKSQ